jgi:hypothetical protein
MRRLARLFLAATLALGASTLVGLSIAYAHTPPAADGEARDRARFLAQFAAEAMNTTAFVALFALPAGLWLAWRASREAE